MIEKADRIVVLSLSWFVMLLVFTGLLVLPGCKTSHSQAIKHYVTAVSLDSVELSNDAIIELQEAVKVDPDFSLAHSLMGDLYSDEGQYEKAAQAYDNACRINPWDFTDHFKLGRTYKILKKFTEAIKALHRACLLKPDSSQANFTLGVCYYQRAEDADPEDPEAQKQAQDDYQQALNYCDKAVQLQPDNQEFLTALGNVYGKQGDDYKAISYYKQALELNPDQPAVMRRMGMVYLRMERFGPAQMIIKKAIEIAPQDADSYIALGYCLLKEEKAVEALQQYQKAITQDAQSTEALNGAGVCSMMLFLKKQDDMKLCQAAIEYWHRSLEIDPEQKQIKTLIAKYQKVLDSKKPEK